VRTVILIAIVVAAVACCAVAVVSSQKATKADNALNQERYDRMSAEESLKGVQTQIQSLTVEVDRLQKKNKSLETVNEQLKAANTEMGTRLEKAQEIKVNLESKINELLKLSGGVPQ